MEELIPITPVNFFQLSLECRHLDAAGRFPKLDGRNKKKHLLPDTSALCHEEHFADVAMGWNKEGIAFLFQVDRPFEQAFYPAITRGDSVEIFLDTRDVKTSGYNTRFCHHFFFLPEAVQGHQAGELTHFRTEDVHELCEPAALVVEGKIQKMRYNLHIWIPSTCLHGYDPEQFDRMGFCYRINRPTWESQHLSVVSGDYKLEQQPSLWSTTRLVS